MLYLRLSLQKSSLCSVLVLIMWDLNLENSSTDLCADVSCADNLCRSLETF